MVLTVWKNLSEVSPPYPWKPLTLTSLPQELLVTFLRERESMDICWFLSLEKQIHYFMSGCVSFRCKGKRVFNFFLLTMVYSFDCRKSRGNYGFQRQKIRSLTTLGFCCLSTFSLLHGEQTS